MRSHFWSDLGKWVLGYMVAFTVACSSPPEYERVEEFPEGMQIDTTQSALAEKLQKTNVSKQYPAEFKIVWDVTTKVAKGFKERDGELTLNIDEKNRTIHLYGIHRPDKTKGYPADVVRMKAWKDQFRITVEALDKTRTNVSVSRTVVGIPYFRLCREALVDCGSFYEPEVSNAKIEQWILTQIDENLRSPSRGGTP